MIKAIKYISAVTVSGLLVLLMSSDASALIADDDCTEIEMVFARGSGQQLSKEEFQRFKNKISDRIKSPATYHAYELGTEAYGNSRYNAIDIGNVWNGNPIGAKASSGQSFDYGNSVNNGVGELKAYLTKHNEKCKDALIVLGGYSQGAQVIGQALPGLPVAVQNKLVFSAFYGDPRLYLPEGKGIYPDACKGKNLSKWRQTIGDCHTDNGSLGARVPYLPTNLEDKVGLWCNVSDFICGSSKLWYDTGGHGKYKDEGGAIDQSALEIAKKLNKLLPPEQAKYIDVSQQISGVGTTGVGVAFILDTTGSMVTQIEQSKQFIRDYTQKIKNIRGRVSLTVFRDQGDIYTAQILSDLQENPDDMLAKLNNVYAGGGGDWEEASLHALTTTFNGLAWKNGATKAAVLITDAPYHNPDLVDGSSVETVAKRSLEIDPVNVYPVVPAEVAGYYGELAEKTSGQVIIDSGNATDALNVVFDKLQNRPTALLKNTNYLALPSDEIIFDASDSYVVDAAITKYEWDFDGDGIFEQETSYPTVSYTYGSEFSGTMQVRLTASNNTVANASAIVNIGQPEVSTVPAAPTNLKVEVISTATNTSTVRLSWQPSDSLASKWFVAVDGVSIGYVTADRTSIEISDVQRAKTVSLGVVGANTVDQVGEANTVNLAAAEATQPPKPADTWWQRFVDWLRQLILWLKFRH